MQAGKRRNLINTADRLQISVTNKLTNQIICNLISHQIEKKCIKCYSIQISIRDAA